MTKTDEEMVAINIYPSPAGRGEENSTFHKIKYRSDLTEKEYDLVAVVEHIPPSTYRVQKLMIKAAVLQKFPGLIKELTGQRWVAVPVGGETREIPDIEHFWHLPDFYLAACRPRTNPSSLARQLETRKAEEILVFYTLKEWWKKNKHLGFSQALKEYREYLSHYYTRIKRLREKGKNINVRVAQVDDMRKLMAEGGLPESEPASWQEAGRRLEQTTGTLFEEFPPFGPVGVIDDEFSAFITFHSYDIKSGNITYTSVLIENGLNVIHQFLIWNTGVNDMLDDMDFIKDKLQEYGVTKKQYIYELMPMLGRE